MPPRLARWFQALARSLAPADRIVEHRRDLPNALAVHIGLPGWLSAAERRRRKFDAVVAGNAINPVGIAIAALRACRP